jgi:hypothetical protein
VSVLGCLLFSLPRSSLLYSKVTDSHTTLLTHPTTADDRPETSSARRRLVGSAHKPANDVSAGRRGFAGACMMACRLWHLPSLRLATSSRRGICKEPLGTCASLCGASGPF